MIVIAEAGVNHNGDISLAKKLIDAAVNAGADYVKFQTWITDEIVSVDAPKAEYQIKNDGDSSQYEMLKKLELSFENFRELKIYAESKQIKFLSTPDDFQSLDFLADELDLDILKVGSGEITNIPFLRRIGSKRKDVILSTGMSCLGEVELAYNTLLDSGAKSVAILHCTSNYPASYASVNLKAMLTLEQAFKTVVGYSDHTVGNEISIAAVALGAQIIEKHFTIDKVLPGPDHKASIDPAELAELVKQIRNTEKALAGSGKKEIDPSEVETKKVVTKGIYVNRKMGIGDVITADVISLKRPATFIPANMYDLVLNKKVSADLQAGAPLKWDQINFE